MKNLWLIVDKETLKVVGVQETRQMARWARDKIANSEIRKLSVLDVIVDDCEVVR